MVNFHCQKLISDHQTCSQSNLISSLMKMRWHISCPISMQDYYMIFSSMPVNPCIQVVFIRNYVKASMLDVSCLNSFWIFFGFWKFEFVVVADSFLLVMAICAHLKSWYYFTLCLYVYLNDLPHDSRDYKPNHFQAYWSSFYYCASASLFIIHLLSGFSNLIIQLKRKKLF